MSEQETLSTVLNKMAEHHGQSIANLILKMTNAGLAALAEENGLRFTPLTLDASLPPAHTEAASSLDQCLQKIGSDVLTQEEAIRMHDRHITQESISRRREYADFPDALSEPAE